MTKITIPTTDGELDRLRADVAALSAALERMGVDSSSVISFVVEPAEDDRTTDGNDHKTDDDWDDWLPHQLHHRRIDD